MQFLWHLLKTVVCRPSKLLPRFAVGKSTKGTHVWESIAAIGEKMVNASVKFVTPLLMVLLLSRHEKTIRV